jgi:hypothetical protein
MPESVAFALPTLPSSDMTRDDQGALIVNQAAATIIAAYLEHASSLHAAGAGSEAFRVTAAELVALVNDVQEALRSF